MKQFIYTMAVVLAFISCNGSNNAGRIDDVDSTTTDSMVLENTEVIDESVLEGLDKAELVKNGIQASIKDGIVFWSVDKEKYLSTDNFLCDEFYCASESDFSVELENGEKAKGVYLCSIDDQNVMIVIGSKHNVYLKNLDMELGQLDFSVGKVAENFDAVRIEKDDNKDIAIAIDAEGNNKEISIMKNLPYDCEFECDGKVYSLSLTSVCTMRLEADGVAYYGAFTQKGNKALYRLTQKSKAGNEPLDLATPIVGSFTYNNSKETITFDANKFGIKENVAIVCDVFPLFG